MVMEQETTWGRRRCLYLWERRYRRSYVRVFDATRVFVMSEVRCCVVRMPPATKLQPG